MGGETGSRILAWALQQAHSFQTTLPIAADQSHQLQVAKSKRRRYEDARVVDELKDGSPVIYV